MSRSTAAINSKESGQAASLSYVLITPARNEEAFIARTIESVLAQTCRPLKWVIVSDGSTDQTDEIVKWHIRGHNWIELISMPPRTERHFSGKVLAFNAGFERVRHLGYDLICNLDADVSFEPDYFEFLIAKLSVNPRLGLVGTNYHEGTLRYNYRISNSADVPGACHLFRRECFESIGGYQPIRYGGIDLVAVLTARLHGWETRAFADKYLIHYRPQGTAQANRWSRCFHDGQHDYLFGGHPLWEIFRTAYRMSSKPFVMGGILLGIGYMWAALCHKKRPIGADLVCFRRAEQMQRLAEFLRKLLRLRLPVGVVEPASGVSAVATHSLKPE